MLQDLDGLIYILDRSVIYILKCSRYGVVRYHRTRPQYHPVELTNQAT